MKVIWEMNTENPVDQKILNALGTLIKFVSPEEVAQQTEETPVAPLKSVQKATTTAPAEAQTEAPAETAPPKKRKKRTPKEKTKEQLLKLSLDEMVQYLEARPEHSIVECRILAKLYNDVHKDVKPILEIMHNLGANNFDDLKDIKGYMEKVIALVKGESKEEPKDKGDDLFNL